LILLDEPLELLLLPLELLLLPLHLVAAMAIVLEEEDTQKKGEEEEETGKEVCFVLDLPRMEGGGEGGGKRHGKCLNRLEWRRRSGFFPPTTLPPPLSESHSPRRVSWRIYILRQKQNDSVR